MQLWPDQPIHYNDSGLVFQDGSWVEGPVENYRPTEMGAWSLMRDKTRKALGLIWYRDNTISEPGSMAVASDLWESTLRQLGKHRITHRQK